MEKAKVIKGRRIHYRVPHPLLGEDNVFDSWMTLCEYVFEIAEKEAHRRAKESIRDLIIDLSNEIIDTAQELESYV
jgi:hypothetical protein